MMADFRHWPAPKTFTKPGDEIRGTFIAWDPLSEKYPILHLRTADGLVRLIRVTQVRLHERLADLLPQEGDKLWIRYDGEEDKAMKGHAKAKRFTVEIRRANGSQPPVDGTGATTPENAQEAGT